MNHVYGGSDPLTRAATLFLCLKPSFFSASVCFGGMHRTDATAEAAGLLWFSFTVCCTPFTPN